ncbi:hypothetical protein KBX06_06430 [Micromonospora sp. C31]|uniref:hypothetical protein n=1 Tax=Micromonospora sp. C31 TaxID=2824876 RepID=UPI001B39406A|nr:hypothetical protein [Micromonospora sp. C31]MBQ1072802.1 hypothetical protein [Micromonospora sp. C31]
MSPRLSGRLPKRDDGLWSRRLLAATAAAAAAVTVVAVLSRVPRFEVDGTVCVFYLFVGLTALLRRWRPRQDARLVWRERVAGLDGVEPGLVARRSLAGRGAAAAEGVAVAEAGAGGRRPGRGGAGAAPGGRDRGVPGATAGAGGGAGHRTGTHHQRRSAVEQRPEVLGRAPSYT